MSTNKIQQVKKSNGRLQKIILMMCYKYVIEMESRYIERADRLGFKGKVNGPFIVRFNFRSDGVISEDFPCETRKQKKIFGSIIGATYKSNGKYKVTKF